MYQNKVLIGSPIKQNPQILEYFLASLLTLDQQMCSIHYFFIDDNTDVRSTQMLNTFASNNKHVTLVQGEKTEDYICDDETHYWNDALTLKVANYKNKIIDFAIKCNFDSLFFVDSDLVLHPSLLIHLKSLKKDIVSEVFWCSWQPAAPALPNTWLFNAYDFYPRNIEDELDEFQHVFHRDVFLNQLRVPGTYEVGGLGACTLISKSALQKGVNFKAIKNLIIQGEDRFFCIRAVVLGIDLFVDTHYPAYHIYRNEDLEGVQDYIDHCQAEFNFERTYKATDNKITLSMCVKNEAGAVLEQTLKSLVGHIDEAVIIDDNSTDGTVDHCRSIFKNIPLHIVKNEVSMFQNESTLRKKQWEETIKTNPDWILNLDADEVIEPSFWEMKKQLLNDKEYDAYSFRLYDMWNESEYRDDTYWNAHNTHRTFLLRYQPSFPYKFSDKLQHCGRFPINIFSHKTCRTSSKIQHFGWSTEELRQKKYGRYHALDPNGTYGVRAQYASILDGAPTLRVF